MEKMKFRFRVLPWFTDGCSNFLINLLKWLPAQMGKRLSVLEFGGGNSSLFFLSKGLKVISVESDPNYVESLKNISSEAGFSVSVYENLKSFKESKNDNDFSIIFCQKIENIKNFIHEIDVDIIVNDGIYRKELLDEIAKTKINKIIINDNVEYSANWGRLDRTSAKPDLIKIYRDFLRSNEWQSYLFEQPEGRDGHGSSDRTGWESPHRWISAVSWPNKHILNNQIMTNLGFPLTNSMGIDNKDLADLPNRCPFDWESMSWLKESFPKELDLKLERKFD